MNVYGENLVPIPTECPSRPHGSVIAAQPASRAGASAWRGVQVSLRWGRRGFDRPPAAECVRGRCEADLKFAAAGLIGPRSISTLTPVSATRRN